MLRAQNRKKMPPSSNILLCSFWNNSKKPKICIRVIKPMQACVFKHN